MLDKVFKLSIIVGVLVASFSVLYYYAIFLPHKEQVWLEQQSTEQRERENAAMLLDQCLREAESIFSKQLKKIDEFGKECNNAPIGSGCWQGLPELLDKVQSELQQDKNNCFKQHPQR